MQPSFNRAVLSSILAFPCFAIAAFAADKAAESEILSRWKATARATFVGAQLTQLLDSNDKSIQYNSTDRSSFYRRAYLLGVIGCTQSAIDDLNKAIKLDPHFGPAYTERAVCNIDLKDYNKALSDVNQAVLLDPRSGDALYTRARLYLLMGKPLLALSDLRRCESKQTKFTPILPGELAADSYNACQYYLGACYEALDRPDDAVRYYTASTKSKRLGVSGYLHRYADQPLDAKYRISSLQSSADTSTSSSSAYYAPSYNGY